MIGPLPSGLSLFEYWVSASNIYLDELPPFRLKSSSSTGITYSVVVLGFDTTCREFQGSLNTGRPARMGQTTSLIETLIPHLYSKPLAIEYVALSLVFCSFGPFPTNVRLTTHTWILNNVVLGNLVSIF